jgi:WD40 repeat protein
MTSARGGWGRVAFAMMLGLLAARARGDDDSGWKVKPDPAPKDLDTRKIGDVSVKVPPSFFGGEVTLPATPSPFVAVGSNGGDNEVREVYDLRDKKRVGRLRGRYPLDKPFALSSDGTLFAGKSREGGGPAIFLISTKSGKALKRLPMDSSFVDFVAFAGPKRVLTSHLGDKVIAVWDARSGEHLRDIRPGRDLDPESIALSPGGRYLALASKGDHLVAVYDLDKGEQVGAAEVPKNGIFDLTCCGLAFSPDGKELAGIFDAFGLFLIVYKLSDGTVATRHDLGDKVEPKPEFRREQRGIEWLPDGSGWLLAGRCIVDREAGRVVMSAPSEGPQSFEQPRRILAGGKLLIVAGPKEQRVVKTVALNKETIARAAKVVRSGGTVTDVELPPLKAADWSKARRLSAGGGGFGGGPSWSVAADPAPKPSKPLTTSPIALRGPKHELRSTVLAGPGAAQALVAIGPQGFEPGKKPAQVDRVDLADGKTLGSFEAPAALDLVAFSPDGKRALFVDGKDRKRLDVYDAESGKHVVGWRSNGPDAGDPGPIGWAAFLDADRALTQSQNGTLVLWSLAEPRAVYSMALNGPAAAALSPGLKWLAVVAGGRLLVLDPATGTVHGNGEAPPAANGFAGVSVKPDGKEAVALIGNRVAHWDLTTGRLLATFEVPVFGRPGVPIAWGDRENILVDNRALIDLGRKMHVWNYINVGPVLGPSPDGRIWYTAGFPSAYLGAGRPPEPAVEKMVTTADDPNAPAILKRGARVSLDLKYNGPPRDGQKYRRAFDDLAAQRAKASGLAVASEAPVRLVVQIDEKDTGKTLTLREMFPRFGRGGLARETMPIYELRCNAWLADGQGKLVDLGATVIPMVGFSPVIHLPADENDPGTYLRVRQWEAAKGWLGGLALPRYLARNGGEIVMLPGTSNVEAGR